MKKKVPNQRPNMNQMSQNKTKPLKVSKSNRQVDVSLTKVDEANRTLESSPSQSVECSQSPKKVKDTPAEANQNHLTEEQILALL